MLALILAAERDCVTALEQKQLDAMRRRAADIDGLFGKLQVAFGVRLASDVPPVVKTFAEAMALESQLCATLTSSLSRPPMQLIDGYDEIDAIVQTVRSRGITVVHLAGRRLGFLVSDWVRVCCTYTKQMFIGLRVRVYVL